MNVSVIRHHSVPTLGPNDPVIEVEDLRKSYGPHIAVAGIDLDVRPGEIFGLLGPNGAGKTTIVETIQGLRRPSGGRIRVLGLDPELHGDEMRRRIGVQLQSSALPDRLRVGEALALFSRDRDAQSIGELAQRWGLTEIWRRPFAKLSGGQQQRLFIALALINRPEVVFFDELTTGLDPHARRATWDLIRRVRDEGATVMLVTHFMEEAENLCDRVSIVDRGRIITTGTPSALIEQSDAARRVTFSWPGADLAWLSTLPGVQRVTRRKTGVEVIGGETLAITTAAALARHDIRPTDFRTHYPNLEEVFLALTGRDLRA